MRHKKTGEPPSIESSLSGVGEMERSVLLAELIALDVDYRRRRGESPTEQDYLNHFPDDAETIREAVSDGQINS